MNPDLYYPRMAIITATFLHGKETMTKTILVVQDDLNDPNPEEAATDNIRDIYGCGVFISHTSLVDYRTRQIILKHDARSKLDKDRFFQVMVVTSSGMRCIMVEATDVIDAATEVEAIMDINADTWIKCVEYVGAVDMVIHTSRPTAPKRKENKGKGSPVIT